MPLTIDLAAAAPHLSDAEFAAWASSQTIFLSSVMGELASERRELVAALRAAGLQEVRWFEELGGRDDAAHEAYLTEVRSSTVYLGLLGDEYGGIFRPATTPASRRRTRSTWKRATPASASHSGRASPATPGRVTHASSSTTSAPSM
jgi:hypothetical protein